MRTLWLADHLLVSEKGHHLSYNGFIADAARRAGLNVRILCALGCGAEIPGGFTTHQVFRRDWRNDPPRLLCRSRPALEILERLARHRFRTDLLKKSPLGEARSEDIVFAEMLAPRNLAGWLSWLAAIPGGREPTLALHLGYAAERFGVDRDIPTLLRSLKGSGRLSRAHFVTDSDVLQQKYQTILQEDVFVLPHVVSRRAVECQKPPGKTAHFVALGNAREEKGFPEVLAAVDILHANGKSPDARFTLQSNDPDAPSAAALAAFRSAKTKSVSLAGKPMDEDHYFQLLKDADVLLLPYHLDKYTDRTSGVFCEALSSGKPVIATAGSFPGREVEAKGIGWLVRDRSPESIAQAILQAVRELEAVAARSVSLMEHYRQMFHPDTFVSQLLRF
jgi:glycosyltransferase involved in cell wall biosynthesis